MGLGDEGEGEERFCGCCLGANLLNISGILSFPGPLPVASAADFKSLIGSSMISST
jgi:hypothetical protein